MILKNKIGSQQDLEIKGTKSVYEPPRLIRFGLVKDLTATGSGSQVENCGADTSNNNRRQGPVDCKP